eukprot:Gb_00623 [translate_table: standard]
MIFVVFAGRGSVFSSDSNFFADLSVRWRLVVYLRPLDYPRYVSLQPTAATVFPQVCQHRLSMQRRASIFTERLLHSRTTSPQRNKRYYRPYNLVQTCRHPSKDLYGLQMSITDPNNSRTCTSDSTTPQVSNGLQTAFRCSQQGRTAFTSFNLSATDLNSVLRCCTGSH